jgi:hypothetical protein
LLCGGGVRICGQVERSFSRHFVEDFVPYIARITSVEIRSGTPSLMPAGISATGLMTHANRCVYIIRSWFSQRCPIPWPHPTRHDQRNHALTSIAFGITTSSGSKIHIARRRRKGVAICRSESSDKSRARTTRVRRR